MTGCLLFTTCYGKERHVTGVRFNESQGEYFIKGCKNLVSKKKHSISMNCKRSCLKKGRGCFSFSILNNGNKPINFYPSNVRVFDQNGATIKIVPLSEQLNLANSDYKWNRFFFGTDAFFQWFNIKDAGMTYEKKVFYGPSGPNVMEGYSQDNYRRNQAYRELAKETTALGKKVALLYSLITEGLNNCYLNAHTIFPDRVYSANLEIRVPKKILKNAKYLIFEYDIGGEKHSFCFYVS